VAPEAITTRLQNVFTKPTDNTDAAAMAAAVITSAGSKGRKSDEVQAAASSIVEVFSKGNTNNRGDTIAEAFAFSAARDATATATVFARAAVDARRRGYERDFGKQCVSVKMFQNQKEGHVCCIACCVWPAAAHCSLLSVCPSSAVKPLLATTYVVQSLLTTVTAAAVLCCWHYVILPALQSRGFVKARSRGSLEDYTSAVSRAIIDEDNDDVVQVRVSSDNVSHAVTAQACACT
jgi:hypothetical protein